MRAMTWILAGVFVLVAVIGVFCEYASSHISDQMRQKALELSRLVKAGDREAAMDGALALADEWRDVGALLCLWVNHQDIDAVSVCIQQLKVSVEENETYHALLYLAELDGALSLIYHRDSFQLQNVL